MKKLFAILALSAAPLLADAVETKNHHIYVDNFASFYVTDAQALDGPTGGLFSAVDWTIPGIGGGDDIFLVPTDSSTILLHHRDPYLVTYNVTATNSDTGSNYVFGLTLNGDIVPGSVYAAPTPTGDAVEQLTGQVVLWVSQEDSLLQLVNNTGGTASDVTLVPIEGASGTTSTASIFIQRFGR